MSDLRRVRLKKDLSIEEAYTFSFGNFSITVAVPEAENQSSREAAKRLSGNILDLLESRRKKEEKEEELTA